MHATLVQIGNSQGVRLPKAVIEQAGLGRDLDLTVADGAVMIRSAKSTRVGWAEAARACQAASGKDLARWDALVGDFDGEWK